MTKDAEDAMVRRNLPLVYWAMIKSGIRSAAQDDALSDGMFTLMRCVRRYDPARGPKFSTYAGASLLCTMQAVRARASQHRSVRQLEAMGEVTADMLPVEPREPYDDSWTDELLSDLTARERMIVCKRFGLHGEREHVLQEIGVMFGMTKDGVRQNQIKAIRKLRACVTQNPELAESLLP